MTTKTANQGYVGIDRETAALKVTCPHCRRRPGKACVTPRGDQFGGWMWPRRSHPDRLIAADADRR